MSLSKNKNNKGEVKWQIQVLPHMCKLQKKEIDDLMYAADEIGAAATSVIAQGGHGYNLLLEARDKFRALLLSMMQHTRICIEEDEESTTYQN